MMVEDSENEFRNSEDHAMSEISGEDFSRSDHPDTDNYVDDSIDGGHMSVDYDDEHGDDVSDSNFDENIGHSADEHDYDDDEEEDDDGPDDDEDDEGASIFGDHGRRGMSVQELLGHFAQELEASRSRRGNADRGSDPFGNGSGARNVAFNEAMPDLLSMLGATPFRRGNGTATESTSSRLTTLTNNVLNAETDTYLALESLREISENLLMSNQLIVDRIIPIPNLVKGIVKILADPILAEELELQLMSCRCVHNLFEVDRNSIPLAIKSDIITLLQNKLQEISYIDLAEQVLETLEFLSRTHSEDLLEAGNIIIYLQYLDFFTIHAQRKAVAIVCNACSKLKISDFDTISIIAPNLINILTNNPDEYISTRLINAFYFICGGLKRHNNFDQLFNSDFLKQMMKFISDSDLHTNNKRKCLDILSVLISTSSESYNELVNSQSVVPMITSCFNSNRTSKTASLNENLMFVPDSLLISLSRLLVLIFPVEQSNLVSFPNEFGDDITLDETLMNELVRSLLPLLVEIFINKIDVNVRIYIAVAIYRAVHQMNSETALEVRDKLVSLFEPSIFTLHEDSCDEKNDIFQTYLLLLVLTILEYTRTTFKSQYDMQLKKEGVYDSILKFKRQLEAISDEQVEKSKTLFFEEHQLFPDDDNNDDDDDDAYRNLDAIDKIDIIEPKEIQFKILTKLSLEDIYAKISKFCETVSLGFELSADGESKATQCAKAIRYELEQIQDSALSQDALEVLWIDLKAILFEKDNLLSSHEFITSGLLHAIATFITSSSPKSFLIQKTFITAFNENPNPLISMLQTSLSKAENFSIIECGLHGDESNAGSLSKEMKLKLIYDSDAEFDGVPGNLACFTISIHSIASIATLNEFLKHKCSESFFLGSLIPGLRDSTQSSKKSLKDLKNSDFIFSLNGNDLNSDDTIFGAIYKNWKLQNKAHIADLWDEVPTLFYRKKTEEKQADEVDDEMRILPDDKRNKHIEIPEIVGDILQVLRVLQNGEFSAGNFVNMKLSAKLSRQLNEPLIVAGSILPGWILYLTKHFPFVFPLETRILFLQSTSFGYGRLIEHWLNRGGKRHDNSSDNPLQQLGTILKRKLKISREHFFASGIKIIDKYGSDSSSLEIEYQDEAGTGLGPTLEFYATMSTKFCDDSLDMWRISTFQNVDSGYSSELLFPKPLKASKKQSEVLNLFKCLGKFIAKSMIDSRIVDFRFNYLFFQLAHELVTENNLECNCIERIPEYLAFLTKIDNQLATSLKILYSNRENGELLRSLTLPFVLPGYDVELISNGSNILVESQNVLKYIMAVADQMIGSGIQRQLENFIEGFSECFQYKDLLILSPTELVDLFGREEEDWSTETLYTCITAEHGYTMDSDTIHSLITIMSSFDAQERRLFLQFITGSPKLPSGGFKSFKPKLTVVLKHAEDGLTPDEYLPSVMTCANYLKLPKYSSIDLMRQRIVQAMNEGSGAFLLS